MKGFFNKIFGNKIPKVDKSKKRELLDPSVNEIIDDTDNSDENLETRFVRLYNETGGKFLYSENKSELLLYLNKIAKENDFKQFWCANPKLQKYLDTLGIKYTTKPKLDNQINLIDCEYLIAFNGSAMISSHQTDDRKLNEMSNTFIIIAYPDQIVKNISDGLRMIKGIKRNNIPTNITTIKGLKFDSMQHTNSKNIYLLLTEPERC